MLCHNLSIEAEADGLARAFFEAIRFLPFLEPPGENVLSMLSLQIMLHQMNGIVLDHQYYTNSPGTLYVHHLDLKAA